MLLSMALESCNYRITALKGKAELNQHLRNLGFQNNEEIEVIIKHKTSLIVMVKNTRYGLENRIANMIEVDKI